MHLVQCLTHSGLGGGQEVVYNLVRSIMQNHPDTRVTIVLPPDGVYVKRFRSLNVEIIEFPFDRVSAINFFRSAAVLRRLHADVIHSHGKGAGFYVRIHPRVFMAGRRVHSYHGFHPPEQPIGRRIYSALESVLLRHTDDVVAVSSTEADLVCESVPRSSDKVRIIENAVDCSRVRADAKLGMAEALETFIASRKGSPVITMIARDDPVKNYPLALKSARLILAKRKDIGFVFVGLQPDNQMVTSLRSDFSGQVYAQTSLDTTASLIKRSTLILLTGRREGSPLVVLEAFCLGTPVVGTDVPGIRDLVKDHRNGLLCREDPASIAEAIDGITSDSDLLSRLRAGALETGKGIDIRKWADRYYQLYS